MTELVLTYIGTLLIGFEFVRKLDNIKGMLVLVLVLPLSKLLNTFSFPWWKKKRFSLQQYSTLKKLSMIAYGIAMIVLLLVPAIISLVFLLPIGLVDVIDTGLNWQWTALVDKFEPLLKQLAKFLIEHYKRYRGLSPKAVVRQMKNTKLPFPAMIGVILITIAFIMEIMK